MANDEKKVGIKFTNNITNQPKLEKYADTLVKIQAFTKGMDMGILKKLDEVDVSKISKDITNIDKKTKTAFNVAGITLFISKLKGLVQTIGKLTDMSAEYTENLNLYQVAFDGATEGADKFINKLTEMYGLDESWLVRTTGVFKQLSNAMNLGVEEGTKLSTLMTQMAIDISSLYNIDIERASSVLQSSLAGQTKPIRGATGGDITQATLQSTLDSLGIERSIAELSYAEKRLVIIISLTQQLKQVTNDFGKTIESPANQMRILNEQWTRLSRAVGNLFLPILAQVLPYLNAILMVLTEIINVVASIFGFNIDDFDYGVGGVSDSVLELEESLNGASAGASDLKKELSGLRSFDKLNVITTPKDTGSAGVGGGSGLNIDPEIMDAFNSAFDEYNSKLDDVEMKANKIRDAIMDWLGFTREINPITGEMEWKYGGIKETLKNVWDSIKNANPFVKTLLGYFTLLAGKKIFDGLKKILTLIGNTGIFKFVKNLLSPLGKMIEYIRVYKKISPTGIDGILGGVDAWKKRATNAELLSSAFKGMVVNAIGIASISYAMDDINEKGLNLLNTLGLVSGSLETIFGGVMIGASIGGGWGAVIGGIAGAVEALITAMINYEDEAEKLIKKSEEEAEASQKVYDSYIARKDALQKEMDQSLAVSTYHQNLLTELGNMIDANGNLKDGYEERAEFILGTLNEAYGTEYTLLDLQIGKYNDLSSAIKKAIEQERNKIILDANKKAYNEALENETQAWYDYNEANKEWNELNENGLEIYEKLNEMQSLFGKEAYKNYTYTSKLTGETYKGQYAYNQLTKELDANNKQMVNQETKIKNLKKTWEGYTRDITYFEDLQTAILTENVEEQNRLINEHLNTVETANGREQLSISDQIIYIKDSREQLEKIYTESGEKITEAQTQTFDEQLENLTNNLLEQSSTVENITPEIAKAWETLGITNKEVFMQKFSQLPEDIKNKITSQMSSIGLGIVSELQKGVNQNEVKIRMKADISEVENKINNFIGRFNKTFGNDYSSKVLGTIFGVGKGIGNVFKLPFLANGGLPTVGQLFVANERGPELVGHIGGQSFVANQNQMMDLLDKKIGNANSGINNATFVIQVGDEEVARKVLTNLQDMAKSNGETITIG